MSEIINDLIVLGQAVPEETKAGRVTVCLAGLSPSRGFIRIYPAKPDFGLHRWDVIEIEVERDPLDTRDESRKFPESQAESSVLKQYFKTVDRIENKDKQRELISQRISTCVNQINEEHRSLGIVQPTIERTYFADNDQFTAPKQLMLTERELAWAHVKRDYKFEPRLAYRCSECRGQHDQKSLDWGLYEWMRKNPTNLDQVWKNLKLDSPDRTPYFLVGNQANRRTSFLVIQIIVLSKAK